MGFLQIAVGLLPSGAAKHFILLLFLISVHYPDMKGTVQKTPREKATSLVTC